MPGTLEARKQAIRAVGADFNFRMLISKLISEIEMDDTLLDSDLKITLLEILHVYPFDQTKNLPYLKECLIKLSNSKLGSDMCVMDPKQQVTMLAFKSALWYFDIYESAIKDTDETSFMEVVSELGKSGSCVNSMQTAIIEMHR